jgi:hypothetical protein
MEARGEGLYVVALRGVEVSEAELRRFLLRADKSYGRLAKALGVSGAGDQIAVDVVEEGGEASGSAEGISLPVDYVLQPERHAVFEHELVHVLAARSWGYATSFLREGLAYHLTPTGSAWKASAGSDEQVDWPATLSAYRGWRHAITGAAAADGQLPPLASLQLAPYFWALFRFHKSDLDLCVAVSAAASFTHYVLSKHGKGSYRRLYEVAAGRDVGWDSEGAAAVLEGELGAAVARITESWTRFAERRGATGPEPKAAYERLRARCGDVSRPAPMTNCWRCGQWRERRRGTCRACGARGRGPMTGRLTVSGEPMR